MAYNEIRPISYQFGSNTDGIPIHFYSLDFPEVWKISLLRVYADSMNRSPDKTHLPHKDLNRTIRALVPDITSIDRYLGGWKGSPWLRSNSTAASPEALRIILHRWAQNALKKVPHSILRPVLHQLRTEMLIWRKNTIPIADWEQHPNRTAKATEDAQFTVFPDFVASLLSKPEVSFELKEQPIQFFRVPISPGGRGAELISWPPQEAVIGRGKTSYYFSILITITVQTVPFDPHPVINISLGIRRWVSEPSRARGGRTSVYVRSDVPWIEGTKQTPSFQVAPIRWTPVGDRFELMWESHLIDILNQLNPQHQFPPPNTLMDDPIKFLQTTMATNAAVVFRNGMKPNHLVKAGLMPGDRKPLVDQITSVLAPQLKLVNTYKRVGSPIRVKNLFAEKPDGENTEHLLEGRNDAIHGGVGNTIGIEIFYQREETKAAFITQLHDLLGIILPSVLPARVQPSKSVFVVDAKPLGAIGDELVVDPKVNSQIDRGYKAINKRKDLIKDEIGATRTPTIAFVELAGADAFTSQTDPKRAIRLGFANTGRLTQFIDRDSDASLSQRVKRCVLDGLRQLGVNQLVFNRGKLPVRAKYVGLWLIYISRDKNPAKMQQFIPVFVLIEPDNHEVLARIPGIDEWLPYRDMLLAVGKGEAVQGFDRREKALPFIKTVIEDEIVPDGDAILMCLSQNLRRAWKWLQDGKIVIDRIAFGEEKPRSISDFEGLRVVRIRSSQQHETPEWYAVKGDDFGFSKGLFASSNRRFASTYGKAAQFKKIRITDSILDRPSAPAWNPGLYELIVAAIQDGDDPIDLAFTAHLLRDMSIQYDDATALPLPLHLAKLTEEYVLLLNYENEDSP